MIDKIRLIIFYELANFLHHTLIYLTMKQFGISREEAHDFLGISFISYIRYKDKDDELSNTIEFYNGQIDTDEILISELEAYKSDYFYCDKCKILKGE